MKNTKIICTIGPASQKPDVIRELIRSGMNVARLNFSHGSYEEQGKIISTKISTPNNPENGTSGGPDTEDKVFCLSSQEAEKYLEGTDYLHPNLTSYALYKFNNFEAKTFMLDYVDKGWWLRTRSDIFKAENINRIKISVRNISGVSDKEHYGIFNGGYLPWALRGVRPAIYVEF